jgi:hypothetical protein
MAGNPHPVLALDPKYRGYLPASAWTLCVGAGISRNIAPDWGDLAYEVVSASIDPNLARVEFDALVKESGWSLDSWIQAAANKHIADGKSAASFKDLIESKLYSKIRQAAQGLGIEGHLTKVLNLPKNEPRERVIEVCELIEHSFPSSSLVQLGQTLIQAAKSNRGPAAVLTFNADTFLETYIDLALRRDHYLGPGPHGHPKYYFVQVTRPSNMQGEKIPIVHCHGCVAPHWSESRTPRDSRDRLVFLEQEYLAMASSSGSWGQITFLHQAQTTKMMFIGMSMSDSNVRRWMSASELERDKDRHIFSYKTRSNPDHIWLKPEPKDQASKDLFLYSLRHLGIRPAWMPSWNELGDSLKNLAAIP